VAYLGGWGLEYKGIDLGVDENLLTGGYNERGGGRR
jgi:hypothetical protein